MLWFFKKKIAVGVSLDNMLGTGKNPCFYPDSAYWKEILEKYEQISFECCSTDVRFGYIEKCAEGFRYKFVQGLEERNVLIERDYINWFVIYFYWNIYAPLKYGDPYKDIREKPYDKHYFKSDFSVNSKYYDSVIFKRIINDFKFINPDAEVLFVDNNNGNMTEDNVDLNECGKTHLDVIWHIPYFVKSGSELDYLSCFRLAGLLDNFTSPDATGGFMKHYGYKRNMFIDED
jgi:hypothetical protein